MKKKVSLILIYPSIDKKDFFLLQNLCKMICLQIPIQSTSDEILKWIDFCPSSNALSYKGYIINGHRFHTKDVERETQNYGVTYDATTMCRASAKDISQRVNVVTYYGVVTDIILLDYHVFYIPVFKCHWANI